MNSTEKEMLTSMLDPIAKAMAQTYIASIILRVQVDQYIAAQNGAEPEDMGRVAADSIEQAQNGAAVFLDAIAKKDRAQQLGQENFV